ncbi:unnamed protein product [Arctogadus glacialis]
MVTSPRHRSLPVGLLRRHLVVPAATLIACRTAASSCWSSPSPRQDETPAPLGSITWKQRADTLSLSEVSLEEWVRTHSAADLHHCLPLLPPEAGRQYSSSLLYLTRDEINTRPHAICSRGSGPPFSSTTLAVFLVWWWGFCLSLPDPMLLTLLMRTLGIRPRCYWGWASDHPAGPGTACGSEPWWLGACTVVIASWWPLIPEKTAAAWGRQAAAGAQDSLSSCGWRPVSTRPFQEVMRKPLPATSDEDLSR